MNEKFIARQEDRSYNWEIVMLDEYGEPEEYIASFADRDEAIRVAELLNQYGMRKGIEEERKEKCTA